MASGFVIASGADLDTVFAPQHSGWPQASATEFFDGSGNDLNLRYANISTGSPVEVLSPVTAPTVVTEEFVTNPPQGQYHASFLNGTPQQPTVPFTMSYNATVDGGILDVLCNIANYWAYGYVFRVDGRSGYFLGQILRMDNGTWTSIGTQYQPVNSAAFSGTVAVKFIVGNGGNLSIYINGTLLCSAVDTTYIVNGSMYFGWEIVSGPTISPPSSSGTEFIVSSGEDLGQVFAAYGSTNVQVLTQPSNVSGSADAGVSGTVTSNSTTCAGTKGGGVYTYTWHIANGSGFTFTAGNSATTAVTGTVSANSTMTGAIYCTISDGVSSINTNSVSISLTNTYTLVSVGTQPSNVSGSANVGVSGTVTSNSTSCAGAGGNGSYSYAWHTSGCTANSPSSASTDFYATVNAASTDNASAYCTISDGVSSVNTNTVSITLTNTYVLVTVGTQPSNVSGSSAAGNPSGTVTSASTTCAGANGDGSYSYTWHTSGCTANSPSSASTDFYATVNAASTDNASAYCTISDGVSSVNTNTIAVALTNTTQPYVSFTIIAETWPNNPNIGYGYTNGFGSLVSVSGLPSGVTISLLEDVRTICAFALSGLSADPGQDSLSSITCNGATFSGSSASSYNYNSGTAEWQWAGSFGFVSGDQYSGTATPSSGASW